MSRVVVPARSELANLPTPLTDGEREVLDFFDQHLDPSWEIYVQPYLNGLRPDFVLLNPSVGMVVFEVRDWAQDALEYEWREPETGHPLPTLWARRPHGDWLPVADDPVARVEDCREAAAHLYCPRIGVQAAKNWRAMAVITAGVIMTNWSTDRAQAFFAPARKDLSEAKLNYYPLAGGDALQRGQLALVFPEALRKRSQFMTPAIAADLRSWLVEPDAAAAQRTPLELDDRQRAIATSRTPTGYRRVGGAAGSGKSVALAARAAQLTSEGKRVLVVTFNITLWHYLRDLAARYPVPGRRLVDRVTWTHFHEFCKEGCIAAGLREEYLSLFPRGAIPASSEGRPGQEPTLDVGLPNLTKRALALLRDRPCFEKHSFDAILVDEGQDFTPLWWETLRGFLRPGGEMLLVADAAQDLYERTETWTRERMRDAGFSGPWTQLGPSYRLPPDLVPYLQGFLRKFTRTSDAYLPQTAQMSLPGFCRLRWIQADDASRLTDLCLQELKRIPAEAALGPVSWSDLHLLLPTHKAGLACLDSLEDLGVGVCHVFGSTYTERKARKMAFWATGGGIKACTVHSFKGWESRAMVIAIVRASEPDLRALYVALTRLKQHELGSYLTVVCTAPRLREFGRTWPEFVDLDAPPTPDACTLVPATSQ